MLPGPTGHPMVPTGAQWYPMVPKGTQNGAQWCPMVPNGTQRYPKVPNLSDLKRDFQFSGPRDPSHPLRVTIPSILPQELREMVEYEPENDLGSWKIMF